MSALLAVLIALIVFGPIVGVVLEVYGFNDEPGARGILAPSSWPAVCLTLFQHEQPTA